MGLAAGTGHTAPARGQKESGARDRIASPALPASAPRRYCTVTVPVYAVLALPSVLWMTVKVYVPAASPLTRPV